MMEVRRETIGLNVDLLGDFFLSLVDQCQQLDSAEAVYRHYVIFCLSHDVQAAPLAVFADRFHAVLSRIKKELL